MKNFVKTVRNNDGSVSVNYTRDNKSVVVPADLWAKIKSHIDFLNWGELSSLVAHSTNGVGIYSKKDVGNANPNADRNWGCRRT